MEYMTGDEIYTLGYSLGYQHPFMDSKYVIEHPDISKHVTNSVNRYLFNLGYSDGQDYKQKELGVD